MKKWNSNIIQRMGLMAAALVQEVEQIGWAEYIEAQRFIGNAQSCATNSTSRIYSVCFVGFR